MLNLVFMGIIGLSVLAIILVVGRKLPILTVIDVDTLEKEREALMKHKIILDRLDRKSRDILKALRPISQGLWNKAVASFRSVYRKAKELDKKYQQEEQGVVPETKEEVRQKISKNLEEAQQLTEEESFVEAERKYIEIISLDQKNISAYESLGELYVAAKKYSEAEEIYRFLIKLNKEGKVAEYCFKLAEILKAEELLPAALETAKHAVAAEENNPKYLDFLLELSIMVSDYEVAEKTYEQLEKVNPENSKLAIFRKRIDEK